MAYSSEGGLNALPSRLNTNCSAGTLRFFCSSQVPSSICCDVDGAIACFRLRLPMYYCRLYDGLSGLPGVRCWFGFEKVLVLLSLSPVLYKRDFLFPPMYSQTESKERAIIATKISTTKTTTTINNNTSIVTSTTTTTAHTPSWSHLHVVEKSFLFGLKLPPFPVSSAPPYALLVPPSPPPRSPPSAHRRSQPS